MVQIAMTTKDKNPRDSLAMFNDGGVEVQDTKRIVRRAEYDRIAAQKPRFGMTSQELFVLHRAINGKAVLERRESLKAKAQNQGGGKTMGKVPILGGQTIACAMDAKDVAEGVVNISLGGLKHWKGFCHYYCIAINETHESFWWDIDDLYEGLSCAETDEDGIPTWLLGADEYHRPSNVPFGWPWGKSPVDNWPIDYMELPGRVCLTDGVTVRPGWEAWGNLHPSGGETGEYHYVK